MMLSSLLPRSRWSMIMLAWLAALLMAGCASRGAKEAERLMQAGRHEEALQTLREAVREHPDDERLRAVMLKQRDTTAAHLLYQAESARAAGRREEVEQLLARLEVAAPGHPRAAWLRDELQRIDRQQRLLREAREALTQARWAQADAALKAITAETPAHPEARTLLATLDERRAQQARQQATLQLATAGKTITLEFREAALRTVFEALSRAANVNFVFDKDVRGDAKVTLFLRQTTVDEALRVILNTQQLGHKLLNPNTVLVFPNTTQKQRDLLDTVTRSFYLVNADPKQVQTMVRTMAKTRDIYVDERLNMLVVRDTPDVVRLVERLIAGMDLPDPEVMLELEVMEVSSKRLNELGLSWPETASYGVPGSVLPLTSDSTGLRWSMANPLAVATLRGTTDATNLLANPRIRARNREKAKVLLGEKLPVFTTTSTANVGVSASVSYLDVGLKLDLEPQVQLDNEVIIKVALEVSSITGKVSGPQGSLAYQVGTRQATTSLRLKDGETQILAGLINDEESRNAAGLPWVHDLPVLGRLFGKTTNTHNKTEVVLLVTPRVIRNVHPDALAAHPMAAGTEASPGAPAWLLSQGEAGNLAGRGAGPSRQFARPSRPQAPEAGTQPRLSGPEEVVPGASFQVSVNNPGDQPLRSTLVFDPGVLRVTAPGASPQGGSVPVEVLPQAVLAVMFTVRPDAPSSETAINLEAGPAAWTVRIRSAGDSGAPGDAAPDDAEAADGNDQR